MSLNNKHAGQGSDIRTYGFGRNTVRIAPLGDGEWIFTIDAVLMGVTKCPVTALLDAKRHLGVDDAE